MSIFPWPSLYRTSRFKGGPPAPDQPFFAIGDVHGRLDLLDPLLDKLLRQPDPIILVGDYIDRGDDSAGVVKRLHDLRNNKQVICLRGNHEEMLLKFIDKPRKNGRIWLRHGGLQTLASFGIGGVTAASGPDALMQAHSALYEILGDQIAWLAGLPYLWQSGNMAVTHAGADPLSALDAQSHRAMAWGHPAFLKTARTDGNWMIYGHKIMPEVTIHEGKVAIDTGAYLTDRLSAIHVTAGAIMPVKA
ncbi:metallophosphoesterase [Yoonia sediminilitoris]|uniref:Serine/threonine protein phosphatase 1 n=1 Tax=Yoonia sediminilitoris TaxID=1286148 RepID=A0A2T6KB90_9RHOB|nr:metallophosphoesterase [Yoonia sediminilitoris]PUB12120.1 serine/threonine protein phosphatase 1 [Yoonia sediminilitoris]RCW92947.1 serine/threonine protein phosphatase 1 [Yoonia sediminilitoris]